MDLDGLSLGESLRRLRIRTGATQEDLAARSGVSVRTISNVEGGRITTPRVSSLRAIATALDLDPATAAALCAKAAAAPDVPRGGVIREPLTRLLGRDSDRTALADRIAEGATRLVTVTGMAGIGKTRLALAVARAVQRGGVPAWWVPLAAVSGADLVTSAVADAVGAPGATAASIDQRLAHRPAVLVLDNLEHLPGVDAVVADLLDQLDGVTVLATSRAPLRIPGEQEWPLRPLPMPADAAPDAVRTAPATALLVERIRSTVPDFAVTSATAPTVAEVCRLLDGLPLALELAAAQWRVRGGDDVLRAIRQDPLALPDVRPGADDRPSLRLALVATCELLSDAQRNTLRCLAVFRGGWTLDAARQVIGRDVVDDLDRLLALGVVEAGDTATGRRFTMLPTITAFAAAEAREQGLWPDLARRHAEWTRRWALGLDLTSENIVSAAPLVRAERDNLRVALSWFDAHDPAGGLATTDVLYLYWTHYNHAAEGLAWYRSFLDRAADYPAHSLALSRAAWLARGLDRLADGEELAEQALREAEAGSDLSHHVQALSVLANIIDLRRPGHGVPRHREAVQLAERLGEPRHHCRALAHLATSLGDVGRVAEAVPLHRRVAGVAAEHGLNYLQLGALLNAAHFLNLLGDHSEADTVLAVCEPLLDSTGTPDARTYWHAQRAIARVGTGDVDDATAHAALALKDATDDQAHRHTNEGWIAHAEVALASGRPADAAAAYRRVLSSRFQLASPAGRCLVLAGLAAAVDDPAAAAAAVTAVEAIRSEHGFPLPAPTRARVAAADRRWREELGQGWTELLSTTRLRPVDDLVGALARTGPA